MRRTLLLHLSSALACLLLALPAQAENAVRSGDLAVHYNAVPSTSLTPEIARQYGITRSANRALVNISVRRGPPGADQAVAAKVTLTATNLSGQRSELGVREVRESEAIYYLAEARFTGNDTLAFELEVLPEEASTPIKAAFRQEFFAQ